jgi:hypothetical protein
MGLRRLGTAALLGASVVISERALRTWYESWGASDDEVRAALPGDGIVPEPQRTSTRAITIGAAPDDVWRWLVQIGHARGGLYSYDWLENLVGCDLHSADELLPDHQWLHPGDLVRMGPEGYPAFTVAEVEPPHHLVLVSADTHTGRSTLEAAQPYGTTWQWTIEPQVDQCRLFSRQRLTYPPGQTAMWSVVQPIAFMMERKMLVGIKQRAERTSAAP